MELSPVVAVVLAIMLLVPAALVLGALLMGKDSVLRWSAGILAATVLLIACMVFFFGEVSFSAPIPVDDEMIHRTCQVDSDRVDFGPDCRVKTIGDAEWLLGFPEEMWVTCYYSDTEREDLPYQPGNHSPCEYGVLSGR